MKQHNCGAPLLLFVCLGIAGQLGDAYPAVASEPSENHAGPSENRAEIEFFERQVRPLLVQHCGECHVEGEAGGLSLASREGLLRGGDSGAVVAPGDPESSRLVAAIRRQTDTPMPPDHPLAEQEVRILERWISRGAHWPAEVPESDAGNSAAEHWAFQPIGDPAVPEVPGDDWSRNAIDPFVLRRLDRAELSPSAEADRRALIRRVTYALTGLPPTTEQVEAFARSVDPDAYEKWVERLLQSPQYGQHQARMWLDLARYSDTKGYVYAREQRFWVHAWNYRDWVVRALNRDIPYDRFLLLQIAADQVPDRDAEDLAAMGFLTLGRRFLGVKHDIIDGRIDVVCRGTMALTVGCACCHDHKYDPIPTEDYYSLYGVFDSCSEQLTPLPGAEDLFRNPDSDIRSKFDRFDQQLQESRRKQARRVRESIGEYLWAQTELHKYPGDGFGQIFAEDDLLPAVVRRFEDYLEKAEDRQDAAEAFDLSRESASTRRMYGQGVHARQTLMARRLVERGVRYVQLWHGAGQPWDNHEKIAENHRRLSAQIDQPIAALLTDLKQRGLLEETLVVWGGEFGRTPTVELGGDGNSKLGRDHNHYGFTVWMAGGGIRGATVHGATDELGFQAVENPTSVHDLHATILHTLGLDHERLTYRYAGRDFRLTDVHGNAIHDILA